MLFRSFVRCRGSRDHGWLLEELARAQMAGHVLGLSKTRQSVLGSFPSVLVPRISLFRSTFVLGPRVLPTPVSSPGLGPLSYVFRVSARVKSRWQSERGRVACAAENGAWRGHDDIVAP